MKNGTERRRHLRAPIALPVFLKTAQGSIKGKTANISVSGLALILLLDPVEIENEFKIIIKPSDDHEVPVTCKKVWMGTMVAGESLYNAIGAEFIKISPSDRKTIISMIIDYYRNQTSKESTASIISGT